MQPDPIRSIISLTLCFALSHLVSSEQGAIAMPQCKGDDYIEGNWLKPDPPVTKKAFYCCGWDMGDYLHNIDVCQNNSEWSQGTLISYQGSNDFVAHVGGHGCTCDAKTSNRTTVTDREQYVWVPNNCSFIPWDAKRFCQALGSRRVLLIGDSTMQQSAASLTNMIVSGKGGCADQLYFRKNYFLSFPMERWRKESLTMVQEIEIILPDMCIFSAGAHFADPGDMWNMMENLKLQLPTMRENLKAKGKSIQMVWKSQNPGHISCADAMEPLSDYSGYKIVDDKLDKYHWNKHIEFDKMTRDLATVPELNYSYIDMKPLFLRPDAHPNSRFQKHILEDCLHYCSPGPLDIFSVIFMNRLLTGEL